MVKRRGSENTSENENLTKQGEKKQKTKPFDFGSGRISTRLDIINQRVDLAKINVSYPDDIEEMYKYFEKQNTPINNEQTKTLFDTLEGALKTYIKSKTEIEGWVKYPQSENDQGRPSGSYFWREITKDANAQGIIDAWNKIQKDAETNPTTKEVINYFAGLVSADPLYKRFNDLKEGNNTELYDVVNQIKSNATLYKRDLLKSITESEIDAFINGDQSLAAGQKDKCEEAAKVEKIQRFFNDQNEFKKRNNNAILQISFDKRSEPDSSEAYAIQEIITYTKKGFSNQNQTGENMYQAITKLQEILNSQAQRSV